MNRILFIALLLITASATIAQTANANEITSSGSAKSKIKPDVVRFEITVLKENEIEKNAIKDLNEEIEKITLLLTKIGFTPSQIKIAAYKISNENRYSTYKISNENRYSNNSKSFTASNSLIVEFKVDNKVINQFYQELQNGNFTDLEVAFDSYLSVDLEKESRKKLLQLAITDAKYNAENIATALDLKLGTVKHVSKEFGEILGVTNMKLGMPNIKADAPTSAGPKTSFDTFEIEDIELEESIVIVFEIVKK